MIPRGAERHDWRAEFEIAPNVIFLNHASFGPVPRRGREAVEALLARQGRLDRDPDVDKETFTLLAAVKKGFARLTGQNPARVAFVPNTSYGLNAVLWGLKVKRGERVLLAANEFPALVYAVQNWAERCDLHLERIPCPDGCLQIDALRRALRRRAAVLAISWVQYFNGYRYDLAELAELCHAHGCFILVDGMQGVGAVPLSMRAAGIDALACGAQKWLFGQTGAGFFGIATDPIRAVDPLYAGWLGYDWGYRFGDLQRWDRPIYDDGRQWEVGTYPFYSLRLAAAGVDLINRFGIGRVYRQIRGLIDRLSAGLGETRYRAIQYPPSHRSGIIAVSGPRVPELHAYLTRRRIYTSLREGNIRISPHFYNTEDEIDVVLEAIHRFDRRR